MVNKMNEGYRDMTKELSEHDHGTIDQDLWHKETKVIALF